MSDYYDHYHRWEALAEFHFKIVDNEDLDDDNYVYCLCSRAFIRDGVKTYYVEKDVSESDIEVLPNSQTQSQEWEDHSHVHFSLDTSYKVKCEKDEGASCYCSASHTDNYCSTDEHDPAQIHGTNTNVLQPSDSGADLTYQDYHTEYTFHDKQAKMDQDVPNELPTELSALETTNEDYRSEDTWEKFWSINGERIIWASWIKKYSDYINPDYLNANNDLVMDDSNISKQHFADEIDMDQKTINQKLIEEDNIRERKFSYDSKVNPYKKSHNCNAEMTAEKTVKSAEQNLHKDGIFLPISRTRSCSEHDRMISPRTLAGTDSMTNVTNITITSYDVSSSHVTSVSSSTDEYSITSSSSDDPSNDQTRIANLNEISDLTTDLDTEDYWQLLWKKHFGDQYALHCARFIYSHEAKNAPLPAVSIEVTPEHKSLEKLGDIKCKNNQGNSQETPSGFIHSHEAKIAPLPKISIEMKSEPQNLQELGDTEFENNEGNSQEMPSGFVQSHEARNTPLPAISIEIKQETKNLQKVGDIECDNSEGNSQDMPSVVEVQNQVEKMKIKDNEDKNKEKVPKPRKRNKKTNSRYVGSVGVLLQSLLIEEQKKSAFNEVCEAGEENNDKKKKVQEDAVDGTSNLPNAQLPETNSSINPRRRSDGEDDPPENKPFTLKRSHELDEEEVTEKIKSTFEIMGFFLHDEKTPKGEIVYRTRNVKLRPPRSRKFGTPRKTYFDNDGNPYQTDQAHDSHEEREMQTDDDGTAKNEIPKTTTETIKIKSNEESNCDAQNNTDTSETFAFEASNTPFPDLETSFSDVQVCETARKVRTSEESVNTHKRRRRNKRYKEDFTGVDISEMPAELAGEPKMVKYWKKRHSLFHRFDEGVKLDHESWFSVTPESVAWHIANKCTYDVVLDAFCGAGGNTIQFARTSKKVIAIDIDPSKIEMARHNATVYGVADRIEFIVGDFFELAPKLQADMVFLSPPWGGPSYSNNIMYDIETMLVPKPASELMKAAREINHNVALYLPRNTRTDQILDLAKEGGGSVEIEQSYLDRRFVAITAYFY